jgi:hypothetical protein
VRKSCCRAGGGKDEAVDLNGNDSKTRRHFYKGDPYATCLSVSKVSQIPYNQHPQWMQKMASTVAIHLMTIAHFNRDQAGVANNIAAVFGTFYKQHRFRMLAPTSEIKHTPG